jgi:hypothetical protein
MGIKLLHSNFYVKEKISAMMRNETWVPGLG